MAESDQGKIRTAVKLIESEALRAIKIFPAINTPHGGKAVIEEELDELWEAVKRKNVSDSELLKEATQVGAMAARFIADLILD